MSIPDYQSLMLPVLRASANGEVRIGQLAEELSAQIGLTPDEQATLLPSGKQTLFANRVHWAKTYLGKAGLVESTRRGHFKITPRGARLLASGPSRIDIAMLNQFEEFRQFRKRTVETEHEAEPLDDLPFANEGETAPARTPDEIVREAHRRIESTLAQELLERIQAAPPAFFEQLVVSLLVSMGFGGSFADAGRALVTGRSGDDGIDGVVDQDALGLDRVYVQAKRYAAQNSIGSGAIRDFFGSLDHHKATKGLFVTTSTFSPAAKETAKYLSKRIVLIDGEQLATLMIRHNVGCRIVETLHIRKVDEEFFD